MSAPITKSQLGFELPKLSYVDASWEEPTLRAAPAAPARHGGLGDWMANLLATFRGWRERQAALAELSAMTDRELMDIGLNRGDLPRVFSANYRRGLDVRTA
ncbi:MAG: DUF1127 domain-containing protein [Rhodospirillales bacterium]|nr:DUF1127 domain-containing protein [Rhodospirillales bacterium]